MPPATNNVLAALAARYERSRAARTGRAARDFLIDHEDLLREAGCGTGEARVCAERDLEDARAQNLLGIERHPRTGIPLRVRFSPDAEEGLFQRLRLASPAEKRKIFAAVFREAAGFSVPERRRAEWAAFCARLEEAASAGESAAPFSRDNPADAREILSLLPRLLAWENESLLRFASSRLCGDSKRLESLQARVETCLAGLTGGTVCSLEDLGILENERAVILHGPLRLGFPAGSLDLGLLSAPSRIDRRDLRKATLETPAARCLTVENLAVLHELAKTNCATVLASSGSEGGFAHSAIIEFLRKLPEHVAIRHCGDTDPKGFDILRDLRERAGRTISSLAMEFDGSRAGPPLTETDRKTIARLLGSPLLTDSEKAQLAATQAAGHKGVFEQEARPLPEA
ncbi:MAG: Wadjet anti-phage system protein JetD domain-containing protein [Terrimicrobiaceae bacterium]